MQKLRFCKPFIELQKLCKNKVFTSSLLHYENEVYTKAFAFINVLFSFGLFVKTKFLQTIHQQTKVTQ